MDEQLQIEIRAGTDPVEVSLIGEIDMATEPAVIEALSQFAGRSVVVDLSRVRFIDSQGVRALHESHQASEAAGGSLALRAPSTATARVLDATGVSGFIKIIE